MEISVGAVLEGTIKSITKFGAFVTLPGGRSGLVHISEISHSYVANVSDVLSEGHRRGRTDQSVHEESRAPSSPAPRRRQRPAEPA